MRFLIRVLCCYLISLGCSKRIATFEPGDHEMGYASWYGEQFHGRKTASGERYNMYSMTAAHRFAPFGSMVRVTNLSNSLSTIVRVNDRGPFVKGRIIDLSLQAAREIKLVQQGTAKVRLNFIGKDTVTRRFFVQAGAFEQMENAEKMLEMIRSLLPQVTIQVESFEGFQRVWIGPFPEDKDAVSVVEKLQDAGHDAFILHR